MAATRAIAAAERAGIAFRTLGYEHDPKAESYGLEAAEKLGLDPARVFKTLVVEVDGRLGVATVLVRAQVDLKALGGKRAAMADRGAAERATGYVLGGISPLGQRRRALLVQLGFCALDCRVDIARDLRRARAVGSDDHAEAEKDDQQGGRGDEADPLALLEQQLFDADAARGRLLGRLRSFRRFRRFCNFGGHSSFLRAKTRPGGIRRAPER